MGMQDKAIDDFMEGKFKPSIFYIIRNPLILWCYPLRWLVRKKQKGWKSSFSKEPSSEPKPLMKREPETPLINGPSSNTSQDPTKGKCKNGDSTFNTLETTEPIKKPIVIEDVPWFEKLARKIEKPFIGDKLERNTLRKRRYVRRIAIHWGGLVFCFLTIWLAGLGFVFFIYWAIKIRGKTDKYLTNTTCYDCGAEIDLVDRWKCDCGDVGRRHIMEECPSCKEYTFSIQCPSCEATLDL